jgi:alcohol dehydrogenase (cytochrome c)
MRCIILSKTITVILTVILLAPIVLTTNSIGMNIQLAKAQLVNTPPRSTSSQPQKQTNAAVTPTTIAIPAGGGLRILDAYYQPLATTVVNGSTVVWRNDDTAPHTATSGTGPSDTNKGKGFDTGIIPTGASSRATTINGQGTVNYFCSIHPWMAGVIKVVPSASGAGSSAATAATAKITTPVSTAARKQQELPLPQPLDQMLAQNKTITTYFKEIVGPKASLLKSTTVTLGTEAANINNWITPNHDIFGTRSSNQTTIGKNNLDKLQIKWVLNTPNMVENSPIIIGERGYVQDNDGVVYAFNATTGQNLWKDSIALGGDMHGLTYDQNVLFVGSGKNATVLAINATDGKKLWESPTLGPKTLGYGVATPPVVWKDYVVVGSAGGDYPPFPGVVQGNITALNRTNGEIIWNLRTTTGQWVTSKNVPPNGGATAWTGGAFDPKTGILYFPLGNPTPDFTPSTRQQSPNYFAEHVIAVNITNGKIIWATPFYGKNSVFNTKFPDTHDDDTSWGTTLTNVKFDNGSQTKVVIGHDKLGNIIEMNAASGKPIWWTRVGFYANKSIDIPLPGAAPKGSGLIMADTHSGIQAFAAADNDTLYVSTSSVPENWFVNGNASHLEPAFNATKNGIGNGTFTAVDLKTGKTKWVYPTEFPTWVSPLVTNGIVFAGHITEIGKPYKYDVFGTPNKTPLVANGMIMALDKQTGKKLWEFRVGSPVGVGGPSAGNGMLYVPIGSHEIPALKTGGVVAFGLP